MKLFDAPHSFHQQCLVGYSALCARLCARTLRFRIEPNVLLLQRLQATGKRDKQANTQTHTHIYSFYHVKGYETAHDMGPRVL